MVNGNYIFYGNRPSSESKIVDDHVHTHTVERRPKRKANRTANELQYTLNLAQLDNDTDSVKYEKKIKEPRLLRYVPTTDVEENFVSEKFETYDLKPTEERPRRYAFTKKPKNPTDGSINYAYSRSSSSCSSPNGNLPTISEHCEQYGTYRVRTVPSPTATVGEIITDYETKLDKYFSKPKEVKKFAIKGSHPDSLYRVPAGSGPGAGKLTRILRILRWPVALFAICVALAVFVYFLMPDNMESDMDTVNATYWETATAATNSLSREQPGDKPPQILNKKKDSQGSKTSEIDFYDADDNKNVDIASILNTTTPSRKLPIPPIFPSHISPEVQYGNEKADIEKLRSPKLLEATNSLSEDSTLKPHITQKPEKPLAIYLNNGNIVTTGSTETITRAETINDFTSFDEKRTTKKAEGSPIKTYNRLSTYKEYSAPIHRAPVNYRQAYEVEPEDPLEVQEFDSRRVPMNIQVNFTSGHSNLFGISIEDAEKMKSTTQNSLYNTRVSPTLPTWRDGDDSTTKKYPLNLNSEVPQCRSPRLAFCRGVLPYDLAGAPVSVGGVDITKLLSQFEYLVATNCSVRVRHFACSLLEPECNPPPFPPKMPCHNLCKAITDNCDGQIPQKLVPIFNCNQYSTNNCMSARAPCYQRELPCGDGTCVPRDWICDGTNDCPEGEDEAACGVCSENEHRCSSGTCIMKHWLCDGYADCPDGDDEAEDKCDKREPHITGEGRGEPGEESAGSAPAPSVRRPNRLTGSPRRSSALHRIVENDSSKELLMTSDSSNAFKRNFTRRPSLSRLIPYTPRPVQQSEMKPDTDSSPVKKLNIRKFSKPSENDSPVTKPAIDSEEGLNLGDLTFLDDFGKEDKVPTHSSKRAGQGDSGLLGNLPVPPTQPSSAVNLDENVNNFERVIDGAVLLQRASEALKEEQSGSPETNSTVVENDNDFPTDGGATGTLIKTNTEKLKNRVQAPCNSGELRCVDGKCITLSQLCDGTIDCSDHADEDNCYT